MKRRDFITGVAGLTLSTQVSKAQGNPYFVPSEEQPHALTFMQWPVNRKIYKDHYFLTLTQNTIAQIANTIAEFEPVIMLAASQHHQTIRSKVSGQVELWDIPTDDLWCRDAGPLFVVDGQGGLAISQIQFNGWGNKQVHEADGKIARRVAQRLDLAFFSTGLKGEPGGVEQNGHGLLVAHESSWLNVNRNPGLNRDQIEARLLEAYGAEKVIWSSGVYDQDITDYHIDALARFTGPGRILMNLPGQTDYNDPFHLAALDTFDALQAAGLDIDVIPEPDKPRVKALDFVASYANYYACNGAIIAAQFGDLEADSIAKEALRRHYPKREVVMLNVDPLGELGGGIHCATQQMPQAHS